MENVADCFRYQSPTLANLKDENWKETLFYFDEKADTIVACVLNPPSPLAEDYEDQKVDIKVSPSDGGAGVKGGRTRKRRRTSADIDTDTWKAMTVNISTLRFIVKSATININGDGSAEDEEDEE